MIRVPEVLALVEPFLPDESTRARESHRRTVRLLRTAAAPFDRACYDPGHVTASAVVLSPDLTDVLVIWHSRLGRWLQPGGHLEFDDASVANAARREAREETGAALDPEGGVLVGVDVHRIPAARGEPDHWHYDLVFAFRLDRLANVPGGEARATWHPAEALDELDADEALRRATARARLALAYSM